MDNLAKELSDALPSQTEILTSTITSLRAQLDTAIAQRDVSDERSDFYEKDCAAQTKRADAAVRSLDASQQLVSSLMTTKEDLIAKVMKEQRDKNDLQAKLQTANATLTQNQVEANVFVNNVQKELHQSNMDKLNAQQIAARLNTAWENSQHQEQILKARVSGLEAEIVILKQQESKSREARGPGTELLSASSLHSKQSLQEHQIKVYFFVESEGDIEFSGIYELRARHCARLQGMLNHVLLQASSDLQANFGEEWEVNLSQTVVECAEISGQHNTVIPSLRGFDQKYAIDDKSREDNIEADIASIDWDKMRVALPVDTVARMQQWLRRKAWPIESYAAPATHKYASWVQRNMKEGSAERLSIGMKVRLRWKL